LRNYGSLIALSLLASAGVWAQGTISTVAGGSGFLDNILAVQARISGPTALAVDHQANAYIGDGTRIRRVNAETGIISTVTSDSGAQILALDPKGNLLIVAGNQLLKLDPSTGSSTTIAGMASDTTPQFGTMAGLATDPAGNILLTDSYHDKIYKIDATSGAVSTFAGIGPVGNTGSPQGDGGPATLAGLERPFVITVDPFGNVFFVEQYWLRRIDGKTGIITTIAPNSGTGPNGDGGPYNKAVFVNVEALATDSQGDLYIADGPYIRKIDWNTGIVSTIAGSGQQVYAKDGVPALDANLSFITGLVVDPHGNIWIADSGNARLFRVAASTNLISTIAGTSANGDGGPAIGATLYNPVGLAADSQGDLYLYDNGDGIRRVQHATGFISLLIPPSALAYGPPLGNGVSPITVDSSGNVFVSLQNTVQRVDAGTKAVTVVAGPGQLGAAGSIGDGGPATNALIAPAGVAIDGSGNLYIADYGNARIRRVDATTGVITTVAGTGEGQTQTFSGLTGAASRISIGIPTSIAIAPNGDIYWTTSGWVLKMNSTGILSVAAGNGGCGYSGDGGSALLATLCAPVSIAFDGDENMFVSEYSCGCIRRVDTATGLIQTVAGTGTIGVSNDGIPATQSALTPAAIAYHGDALYLVDSPQPGSSPARIRAVTPPTPPSLPQPPAITAIVDAVDYRIAFSPGAIVSIFGNYLGGQSTSSAQAGANGLIGDQLGGDRITFNATAAPLLYVSAGQINTVIPFSLQPAATAVQVTTNAGTTKPTEISVQPTSLSLFPGLIFNPDGTLNSATNPAPKGATLVMYGTGIGVTSPPLADGSIVHGPPFPTPDATFSAVVTNGTTQYVATIRYLGPLPGFVAGAVQANIQLPDIIPAGKSSLNISDAEGFGAAGQTIYILSDLPVLSSISPAPPIPQSVGLGNYITLSGANLTGVTSFEFFLHGQPVNVMPAQDQPCTATSCTIFVNFNGMEGEYSVAVTNPANQISNQFTFAVQPYSAPTVTGVQSYPSEGPVNATQGLQLVDIIGTNFLAPVTVTIYYQGALIATLNSTSQFPPQIDYAQLLQIDFDFQGKAGSYAIQVSGTNGSSGRFNFTVAAP
jgi:uncharacterized protein (TIGR03437 family)